MKKIKAFLLKLLGQEGYLHLTSRLFFLYFNNGLLRNKPAYYTHYFVKNFIREGQTVVDIGANLGYYSRQFAELVGRNGKVLSVEPIELYRKILTANLHGMKQVEILPYALGQEEAMIKMGNPSTDKHRHGLMRVLNETEASAEAKVYEVQMKNPVQLFSGLEKIDYIKCDIEGYEVPVIPIMQPLIEKHRPIMQIETDGDNKRIIHHLLTGLDYSLFYVKAGQLIPCPHADSLLEGDLIGIPADKLTFYQSFVGPAN